MGVSSLSYGSLVDSNFSVQNSVPIPNVHKIPGLATAPHSRFKDQTGDTS